MLQFTTDQWVILGLVFVLGTLIGMWLTSGPRRKWKTRYNDEVRQRKELEQQLRDREAHWGEREKEWRERETLASAANRNRGPVHDQADSGYGNRMIIGGGPRQEPIIEDRMRGGRHPDDRRLDERHPGERHPDDRGRL